MMMYAAGTVIPAGGRAGCFSKFCCATTALLTDLFRLILFRSLVHGPGPVGYALAFSQCIAASQSAWGL
jgi:hypothetical protein